MLDHFSYQVGLLSRWLFVVLVSLDSLGVAQPLALDGNLVLTEPMQLKAAVAFPNLTWANWTPVDEQGRYHDFRPIVLTHAGDGSDRIFVATQRGVVHVFENRHERQTSEIFLNISDQVRYDANENEEGFLGFAFHPDYSRNGDFYIYYTTSQTPHTSIIAHRRVSSSDPNRADADFEEELMRIKQPFWNHNGGCLVFGPDGYLYISLGDGGSANDPEGNGQNTQTLLGSILRIDVNGRSGDRNYAIPPDNPFAKSPQLGKPEIFAYGLRNVWGMAFDGTTGEFWAADVGQNKWEEVNLIVRGGNYGWNRREAMHDFLEGESRTDGEMIDPIWEYDHDTGKSITGGLVYRGQRLPELSGAYVYADYVSGAIWALRYDSQQRRVVSNRRIESPQLPVTSFGVDQNNELYFTVLSADGRGIYQLQRAK